MSVSTEPEASSAIICEPLRFPSADGRNTIHAKLWRAEGGARPRGTVQLVHGMEEHIGRYDAFARYLVGEGYAVVGHDHLGHGASCPPEEWGVLDPTHGKEHLLADMHTLRGLAADTLGRGLPTFLFGHSMGSFLTRAYITRHGEGLSGAILCGTGYVSPALSWAGNVLARALCALRGTGHVSGTLNSLGVGAYAKQVDKHDSLAWISYNEHNIQRYRADERCGFPFAAGGYAMLTSLTGEVCRASSARRIPKALPLLYIAGDGDPVGACGKGVQRSAQLARDAGVREVQVKIYAHMRHEILNEVEHMQVYEDVARWLAAHEG